MDKMRINGLSLMCIIGTKPAERKKKQRVLINITLDCDLRQAGKSDKLTDTVNYNSLAEGIQSAICKSRYYLIERLAEVIAAMCLKEPRVKGALVIAEKPGALNMARSASVEIYRRREKK